MPGAQYYDGKKLNVPLSTEAGHELYERWVAQSLSSLLSAVANKELKSMNEYKRSKLFKCSKVAETVYEHAKCVFDTIDAPDSKGQITRGDRIANELFSKDQDLSPEQPSDAAFEVWDDRTKSTKPIKPTIQYRSRRDVIQQKNYQLHTEYENITPFGLIGKMLSSSVNVIKNKKPDTWDAVLQNLQVAQKKVSEREKQQEKLKKRFSFARHGASRILKSGKLTKAEKELAHELGMPEAVRDGIRMHNDIDSKMSVETVQMLRTAAKLAALMSGNNKTAALVDKKLRIASPRLLSVVPETDDGNNDELSFLSPSLFSLHDKGKGIEKLLSLPSLINAMNQTDYKDWLNFIFEASGVTDNLAKIQKDEKNSIIPYEKFPKGIDGQPMYFTKENLTEIEGERGNKQYEVMEELNRMYTKDQHNELNEHGYTIMTKDQIDLIYGKDSPYASQKSHQLFQSLGKDKIQEYMVMNLRSLAKPQPKRRKRQINWGSKILSPIVLDAILNDFHVMPIVLSPVLLTTLVFSPALMGPVILSPWLFVAVVISPRVMCPIVLSPVALSTVVLSPLVMDPLILTPGAMAAFVLSPNVLSPNVLTPTVMCPLILCPFALSPNVFSPAAVTGLILSPFVLSPNYFSPAYFAILYMSPHAFSPNINSSGKGVSVILSPSAFS